MVRKSKNGIYGKYGRYGMNRAFTREVSGQEVAVAALRAILATRRELHSWLWFVYHDRKRWVMAIVASELMV